LFPKNPTDREVNTPYYYDKAECATSLELGRGKNAPAGSRLYFEAASSPAFTTISHHPAKTIAFFFKANGMS